MSQKYSDSKYRLGPPYADTLTDFLAANYNGFAIDLIREAVKEHIEKRLEEPVMRERYEKARRDRLGLPKKVVQLVKDKD